MACSRELLGCAEPVLCPPSDTEPEKEAELLRRAEAVEEAEAAGLWLLLLLPLPAAALALELLLLLWQAEATGLLLSWRAGEPEATALPDSCMACAAAAEWQK